MTGFLLDTNVLSELRRREPDAGVVAWLDATPEHLLHVSVLTVGEIRHGIDRLAPRDGTRAAALEAWLDGLVAGYGDRIVEVDLAVAQRWGALRAERPLPVVDGLLAATAVEHHLTLVTRNVSDVEGLGASVLDPFAR